MLVASRLSMLSTWSVLDLTQHSALKLQASGFGPKDVVGARSSLSKLETGKEKGEFRNWTGTFAIG